MPNGEAPTFALKIYQASSVQSPHEQENLPIQNRSQRYKTSCVEEDTSARGL